MSEAELIEIAQRRRKLEDLHEFSRKFLPREANQSNCDQFATYDAIVEALEACRDDMNALCDLFRGMK